MPQLKVRIGCVVLAVIMSAVTYYFVEPRLRWGRYGGYKAAGLLSVMVAVGVAGYSIERHDGYTARMNDPEQEMIDAVNKRLVDDYQRCLKEIPDWPKFSENPGNVILQCKLQRAPGKNTIALIGDSHAGMLYPGLASKTKDEEGIAVFPAGCAIPLIGLHAVPNDPYRAHNEEALAEGFRYIMSHSNIRKVVLSHYPDCSWNNVVDLRNPGNQDFGSILRAGFTRTYDALTKAGKEIYVVMDNPTYEQDSWPKCNASVVRRPSAIPSFLLSKKTESCFARQADLVKRKMVDNWNTISHELAAGYMNIHFIDLEQLFCRDGTCSMLDSKANILYMDFTHLNAKGSIYAAPLLLEQLRK